MSAGSYIIRPHQISGSITIKNQLPTFQSLAATLSSGGSCNRPSDNLSLSSVDTSISEKSDPSDHSQGFKMRLVYRDKGCVVCLAAEIEATYKYRSHSSRFEGAHIIAVAYHQIWDWAKYSELMNDPYTDPVNANSPLASPTTFKKTDSRRMNSLENGILLCLTHHKEFDNLAFSIHPTTHELFSFHPDTKNLQNIRVTAPWDNADELLPPPHPSLLRLHYSSAIMKSLKASGDCSKLEEDDEDEEEEEMLSEPAEDQHEDVKIWLKNSASFGSEIVAPRDTMAGSKVDDAGLYAGLQSLSIA